MTASANTIPDTALAIDTTVVLDTITAFLADALERTENPSLGDGTAGILLFLAYYNKLFPGGRGEVAEVTAAEKTYQRYNKIAAGKYARHLTGAGGIVVVFEHLLKQELLESDVREVFHDVDRLIREQLLYDHSYSLHINKIALGGGIYMDARVASMGTRRFVRNLKNREALIASLDRCTAILKANQDAPSFTNEFLNNLALYIPLLTRKSMIDTCPAIAGNLAQEALQFVEETVWPAADRGAKNTSGVVSCLYACQQAGWLPQETVVPAIVNIMEQVPSVLDAPPFSFECIRQTQQLNRLFYLSGDERFRQQAGYLLGGLVNRFSSSPGEQKLGLTGISGLGLCLLSWLDASCLLWDEVVAVS